MARQVRAEPSFTANSVRRACRIGWRYRWRAMLFLFLSMLCTLAGISLSKRIYESESLLFVRLGRENVVLDPTATVGQVVALNETRENEIRSSVEILTSRNLREKVVDKLGPTMILVASTTNRVVPAPRTDVAGVADLATDAFDRLKKLAKTLRLADSADPRELAVLELGRALQASVPEKTNVINVSYESHTPQQSQQILQAVLDQYLEEHVRAHRTQGSHQFFEEQVALMRAELDRANQALRTAKTEFRIASIGGKRELLEQLMQDTEARILASEAELASSSDRVAQLRESLAALPERITLTRNEGLANESADLMRPILYNLQSQEKALLATHDEDHPKVIAVREQVRQLTEVLDKETVARENWTTGLHPARQPLEVDMLQEAARVAALKAELQSLVPQRDELAKQMARFNEQEIQIADLQRNVELAETNLRSYSDRLEQARIEQVLEMERISNINVVQPPSLPQKPTKPRKFLIVGLGLMAAILGSVGIVYLSHQFDDRVYRQDEVEDLLELPVLLSIPQNGNSRSHMMIG